MKLHPDAKDTIEDQRVLLLEARTAICRVEYLLELLSYHCAIGR